MIQSYFKIAWRNLRRHKSYAFINVLGLTLGIACGIIIFTVVNFHLSFDTFHSKKDRIYRLVTEWHNEDDGHSGAVPQPLGKEFRNNYTYAEKTARLVSYRNSLITLTGAADNKKFVEEEGIVYAETEIFDIFDFPLAQGDKRGVFANPGSAIVTEKIARKYFGKDAAVGKTFKLNNGLDFMITGVLKDLPANTGRRQEIWLSYADLAKQEKWLGSDSSWPGVYSGSQCYTLLKPGVTPAQANKAFPQIVNKYYPPRDAKIWFFKLQPISEVHFDPQFGGYVNKSYLWALSFIGLFLIITACVNFINLATAQALNRSKEVGIRKVLGSLRQQLFWQFIAETALITAFATMLAIGLARVVLPWLNQLLESEMSLHLFTGWQLPLFLLVMVVLVIFFAGSYPGLVLARFQPVLALKSKLSQKHIGGFSLRRILVVAQFAISQILIIGTIVIASQMHYSKNSDLGFDKQSIVMLPIPTTDANRLNTLRNQLAAVPGVEKVSLCSQAPASSSNSSTGLVFENRAEEETWGVNIKKVDDQYLSTFNLKLVAGRNFYPSDTLREYLVNETFAKKLNLKPADLIGKMISTNGSIKAPIVGVVKDFYNYSFHEEIAPIAFQPERWNWANCAIKMNTTHLSSSLASFEKIWNGVFPEYLYSYQFLDERLKEFYEVDTIMMTLVQSFAIIAIVIGCLGLYGLVSFMAIRKTKEIGVRKVLGASVQNILWMFGKEFSRLLLVAFVIAAPFAWWAMTRYLQDFQYRVPIGASIFAMAIGVTFLIAAITVGYRSLRSALTNPIKSLRTE